MRYTLATLTTLTWSLWFGGLVALAIFVMTLFIKNRDAALHSAPYLFEVFERYQLILAAVALITTALWWTLDRRRTLAAIFILLLLSSTCTAISAFYLTPPMLRL